VVEILRLNFRDFGRKRLGGEQLYKLKAGEREEDEGWIKGLLN